MKANTGPLRYRTSDAYTRTLLHADWMLYYIDNCANPVIDVEIGLIHQHVHRILLMATFVHNKCIYGIMDCYDKKVISWGDYTTALTRNGRFDDKHVVAVESKATPKGGVGVDFKKSTSNR